VAWLLSVVRTGETHATDCVMGSGGVAPGNVWVGRTCRTLP
jgi:hypothetical protein